MPARSTSRRPTAPRRSRVPAWSTHVPGPNDPLPQQVQQFLDWLRIQRNRPPSTVRAYRQDLAKFVAFIDASSAGPLTVAAIAMRFVKALLPVGMLCGIEADHRHRGDADFFGKASSH